MILPYSGVYAQLGEDITNAMELYVDEQDNEIAGRPVEIVQEDTEADPQTGVQDARTLLEREDVDFLTGAVSTSVAYGVIDVAEREQVPFVISNALGNDATRQGSDYVFRTSGNSWQVTHPMGHQYLVDQGVEEIFVSAADYAAGRGAGYHWSRTMRSVWHIPVATTRTSTSSAHGSSSSSSREAKGCSFPSVAMAMILMRSSFPHPFVSY